MVDQIRHAPSPITERPAEQREDHQRHFSETERDALIRSVIASQSLEGVTISYDEAAQLLDEVLAEPLTDIG